MYTLLCLLKGNTSNSAFAIEIDGNKLVSYLKDAIKAQKKKDFADVDANKLKLWKVNISDEVYDLSRNNLQLNCELLPTKKISKYFPDSPAEEHIHIIVGPPICIKCGNQCCSRLATLNCHDEEVMNLHVVDTSWKHSGSFQKNGTAQKWTCCGETIQRSIGCITVETCKFCKKTKEQKTVSIKSLNKELCVKNKACKSCKQKKVDLKYNAGCSGSFKHHFEIDRLGTN
ncbi:unnamed protein product [Rhizophagus irregularis]|nr:unnamed protein product [Rhizophagus irregularis]